MKRWSVLLVAVMLALALAGTASAAASKEKPVQVFLNGKAVNFQVAPKMIENKTFVEFRTLFEQLGYAIEYATQTKTIKASSAMHQIEMTVGGDVAFVDGKTVPINGQLKVVGNRTMVGLRFVAELSGLEVGWDSKTYRVTLADKGPTPEQQKAVFGILDRMLLAEAASDADGMIGLFTDDSPLKEAIGATLKEQMKKVKTRTTIVNKRIESYSGTEAILVTTEDTVKVSGGFYADNISDVKYTLRPGSDGQWRIYVLEPLKIQYTNVKELFNQAAAVPENVKSEIEKLLNEQIKATKEENLDAYLATMTYKDDAEKEMVKQQLQQVFAAADSTPVIEKWLVVDYNGSDQATILWSLISEVKVGATTVKTKVVMANDLVKINGQWLFRPISRQLSVEQL